MIQRFRHFVAIDWSGAAGVRHRGIAVAMCRDDGRAPALVRDGQVWSRAEALDWLSNDLPPDSLVGLDLGMALPFVDVGAYFPGWTDSPANAHALWRMVDAIAADEPDLGAGRFVDHAEASRHFHRHGNRRGEHFRGRGRLRVTELAQAAAGLRPYSNFNLVGAAQVGKSSLTGMRLLHKLGRRVRIWPFDAAEGSTLVEIYTSLAARDAGRPPGRSKMRTGEALDACLTAIASAPTGFTGPLDDHRTDALLSAAWLRVMAHRAALWSPRGLTPAVAATEGWTFGIG